MQLDKAGVVVVGGGTVGVSTAYFLATKGHDVVLVETESLAYGASGRNMGFLHMHNRNAGYELDLARAGRALYDDFAQILGPTFEFQANGAMTYFHTDDQRQVFKELVEARRAQGYRMELLDEQQAHEAAPILSPDVIGSTFNPEDAQIRTPKFVRALAQEARRLGVRIYENAPVTGLMRRGDAVVGVHTEIGDVSADRVVWAGGAWSKMLESYGLRIPIIPERLGAILFAPVAEKLDKIMNGPLAAKKYAFIRSMPSYRDEYFTADYEDPASGVEHLECYAKTEDGNLFVGCPMDYPETLDHNMPAAGMKMAIDAMVQSFPQYKRLGIVDQWTGILPATPDSLPIVDEIDHMPGLVLSTGHVYGNLAGPISGKLVAELLSGETPSLSMAELAIDRPALQGEVTEVRW